LYIFILKKDGLNMKKSIVSVLLSAAVLSSVCVPSASAVSFDISDIQLEEELDKEAAFSADVDLTEENDKTADSSEYKIDSASGLAYTIYTDSNGKKSVTVYGQEAKDHLSGNNKVTSVTIPSTIEGLTVTRIGNYAFENYTALQKVVMPDTILEIGISAFNGCSSLKNITFSKKLNHLDVYAFKNCVSLTEVNLPDTVETVYTGAFYGCSNMTTFHIPASLWFTGSGAMYLEGCPKLRKLTFSSSIAMHHYVTSSTAMAEHRLSSDVLYIPSTVKEITIAGGKLSKNTKTNSDGSIYYDFVVCGIEGSYAQTWAKENGITFYTVDFNESLGDVDGSGTVDALDASVVLTAYAKAAVGKDNGLDSSQESDADVNGDGSIDALDASVILSYYAYTATGGSESLADYIG
jgi:hypothetical protein